MKRYIFLLIICFTINVFAQGSSFQTDITLGDFTRVDLFKTGISLTGTSYWGAAGSNLTDPDNPVNSIVNPAAMHFTRPGFYAETGRWSKTDYIYGMELNNQWVLPTHASFSMPYRNFNFVAGYSSIFNHKFVSPDNSVPSLQQTGGTVEYYDYVNRVKFNLYFASMSIDLNEFINLGITAGMTHVFLKNEGYHNAQDGNGFGIGFIPAIEIVPNPELKVSFVLRYFPEVDFDIKFDNDIVYDTTYSGSIIRVPSTYNLDKFPQHFNYPTEIESGLSWRLHPKLLLSGKIAIKKWKLSYEGDEDIADFHIGAQIDPIKHLSCYLGYFTKNYRFSVDNFFFTDHTQKFLSVGLSVKNIQNINISLNYLNSELLTSDDYKEFHQQYGSVGIGYQF